MFQRIPRSFTAPLALLLGSIAAPPSRADFILYAANGGVQNPAVVKVTSSGQTSTLASGFQSYGVATDSIGDVFVSEETSSGGKVVKISSSGTTTLYSDSSPLQALGRDSHGNLFVTYVARGGIQEILAGGGVQPFSNNNYGYAAHGIAIDSSGNVFLTDEYNNRVVKLDSSGNPVSGFSLNLAQAWGVAIDPISKNLFVSSEAYGSGEVREYNPITGGFIHEFSGPGFTSARGLAFDSNGNLFVGDQGNGTIYELQASDLLAKNNNYSVLASGIAQPDSFAIFEPQAPSSAAPEPSSLTLLGLGFASLAAYRWRRRSA